MRSSILLLCVLGVMGNTPAPAPDSGDTGNKQTVNPELIGRCCAPGRCNTDTTKTYTDPATGVTTGSASDCAQYFDTEGKRHTSVDYATCKDASDCTDPANSCGGYSATTLVPGEVCSASSFGMICCVPGQDGLGSDCAKGTNSDGSDFNSAGWGVCKYELGCTDAANMCGGYNIAGVWVKAGKYGEKTLSPTSAPGQQGDSGTKKSSGGLSTGAIVGIAIGGLVLVGIAMMMFTGSNDDAAQKAEGYQMQGDDATYLPPSDAADHQNNNL